MEVGCWGVVFAAGRPYFFFFNEKQGNGHVPAISLAHGPPAERRLRCVRGIHMCSLARLRVRVWWNGGGRVGNSLVVTFVNEGMESYAIRERGDAARTSQLRPPLALFVCPRQGHRPVIFRAQRPPTKSTQYAAACRWGRIAE